MRTMFICITFITLSACNSTDSSNNSGTTNDNTLPVKYIDLTAEHEVGKDNPYWKVKKRVNPRYPVNAARDGLSGCVELVVGINSSGTMSEYKVVDAYPKGIFDDAAAYAMTKWKWIPTESNADKAPVLTKIQLDFMVQNAKNKEEATRACGFKHWPSVI